MFDQRQCDGESCDGECLECLFRADEQERAERDAWFDSPEWRRDVLGMPDSRPTARVAGKTFKGSRNGPY